VLAPGGTADPADILELFLGRRPCTDAFFQVLSIENF
jgi:Zn-dependent oligopeptidase